MARDNFVYAPKSTVGGATITLSTGSGTLFGGFFLNGSAGGTTITVYNSATLIISTSMGANAFVNVNLNNPVALTQIVATCSGTGYYTVFYAK